MSITNLKKQFLFLFVHVPLKKICKKKQIKKQWTVRIQDTNGHLHQNNNKNENKYNEINDNNKPAIINENAKDDILGLK